MATTTNYGWTTPDDTALVKDGAAAIRTLGSSVDTTTKNLNPSTTAGDIEFRSSTANVNTRLAIGAAGSRLVSDGSVPSWSTPPAFLARINTNQSIATSTITKVAFDTEIFDTASAYDPTTNYRFTVPAGQGGYYLIGFDVAWGVYTAAHQVFMYIYKNGSSYEAPLIPHRDGGSDVVATGTFSKVVQLAATDYVEAFVQHNRGSNAPFYSPNANFWGHKI
jgi:hypothetical protein